MKTEGTNYQKEDVKCNESSVNTTDAAETTGATETTDSPEKNDKVKKALAGAGILLGAAASFGAGTAVGANSQTAGEEVRPEGESVGNALTDGQVEIATGVSDDMSFSEAFGAARAEVGSSGAFEWRGNVYSTFTAEEWDNMTWEEKNEYNNHFAWGAASSEEEPEIEIVVDEPSDEDQVFPVDNDGPDSIPEDVEVISDEPEIIDYEPEVEILGVIQDDESGMNSLGALIDGELVMLTDLDGKDDEFDIMWSDENGDGEISDNEIHDISDEHIHVSDYVQDDI